MEYRTVLVRLTDDYGAEGWVEAAATKFYGETPDSVMVACRDRGWASMGPCERPFGRIALMATAATIVWTRRARNVKALRLWEVSCTGGGCRVVMMLLAQRLADLGTEA